MSIQDFNSFSTKSLVRRMKMSNVALIIVWIASAITIAATVYKYNVTAEFPVMTFVFVIVALMASIPVFFEKKQIDNILKERNY